MNKTFSPAWGDVTSVTNATSATAAVVLPKDCDMIVLTNTSATAISYATITPYETATTVPTGTAPTDTTAMPILPETQIALHVGRGLKVIRTIASAADGALIITPGRGV